MGASHPDDRSLLRAVAPRFGIAAAALLTLGLLSACVVRPATGAQDRQGGDDREGSRSSRSRSAPSWWRSCSSAMGRAKEAKGWPRSGHSHRDPEGGESGPVIVPGDPDASLLVRAIRYTDAELKMPPDRRLAPEEVAAFEDVGQTRRTDAAGD